MDSSHMTAVKKYAGMVSGVLAMSALLSVSACAQDQQKEQPKLDDLVVAGAKFGVNFYKGLGAAYKSGEAERAYKTASDNSLLETDLSSIVDAYKTKKEEAQATANFSNSAGSVFITGTAAVGLVSGIGTVPTALFLAGANYANKQAASSLREAGEARAMTFLKEATQKWQATNGATYSSVRAKLISGNPADTAAAIKEFDKATGMLSDLRQQLSGDSAAADVAQSFIIETMKTTEEATIAQTAQNTSAISDLANQVRVTRSLADKTIGALQNYADRLDQTDKVINDASQQIQALEKSQSVTSQQVGAIEDLLYQQQPPAAKIYLLQNNYKPGLSDAQRQQLITYFQAEQRKEQLIADSAEVVNVAQEVQGILSNLGIHDPVINKAVQVSSVAQKAMSSALTGNYLGAIVSVTSLFGGQSDPEAEHFAAIMGYLQKLDEKLTKVLELQVKTLEAIQTLSNQVAEMDKRLNQRLDRIDFEIKVISDNLKSIMWTDYLSCNGAWEDRTVGGTASFDDDSFAFASSKDAAKFASQYEGKALECAKKLDNLFLSIKASKVFGRLLSLTTAASTDFTVLQSDQGSTLQKGDLERFLTELYRPTVGVVNAGWDHGWGSTATLIAALGDPARNVKALQQKLETLKQAKSSGKPLNACSEPTVLSLRLRSLLCGDTRYAPSEVPKMPSDAAEKMAEQRAGAFMNDPLVRDQLPYLAAWTGLVARPYDFWTGSGETTYSLDQLLNGKGAPRGKDVIWSLLAVLDVAVAQQAVLHGDITAKVVYDLTWSKTEHRPTEPPQNPPQPDPNPQQTSAIKLLLNSNNPWLGKNVLLMGLQDSLFVNDVGVDPSIPYQKAIGILNSVEDLAAQKTGDQGQLSDEQKKIQEEKKKKTEVENQTKIQNANFALRGIFQLPDNVSFTVEDKDDGSGGRVRKLLFVSGSYKLELPTPSEFGTGQFSYPPSLMSLLHLREVMTDRLVDYEIVSGISDKVQQKRVAALLFSGLGSSKPFTAH